MRIIMIIIITIIIMIISLKWATGRPRLHLLPRRDALMDICSQGLSAQTHFLAFKKPAQICMRAAIPLERNPYHRP